MWKSYPAFSRAALAFRCDGNLAYESVSGGRSMQDTGSGSGRPLVKMETVICRFGPILTRNFVRGQLVVGGTDRAVHATSTGNRGGERTVSLPLSRQEPCPPKIEVSGMEVLVRGTAPPSQRRPLSNRHDYICNRRP
jgi:hypothetical protein